MMLKNLLHCVLLVHSVLAQVIFNEVDFGGSKVEMIALPGSYPSTKAHIISGAKVRKYAFLIGADYQTETIFKKNIPSFPKTEQFLLVFYKEQSDSDTTLYADFVKENILDAIVFSPTQNDPNQFSDKIPEWDNKVLYISNGANAFSKCFKQEPFIPNYWFERPVTLLTANDCPEVDPNAGGDPHFSQKVVDSKTRRMMNICYDIVGKSSQSINILNDNSTNTNVQGVLKDDYYMHQIIIQYKGGVIIVDNTFIQINNKKMKWANLVKYKVHFATVHVKSTEEIQIETFYKKFKIVTIVKKEFKSYSGSFLNVYFEELNVFYENLGGLIGDIGKKTYIFNDEIQVNSNNVRVDNIEIESTVTRRWLNECYLLPIAELIHPKTISDYIH